MPETLKQVAERLALDLAGTLHNAPVEDWPAHTRDALDEAMRAALAEPSAKQLNAGVAIGQEMYDADKAVPLIVYRVYEAMAAERLKELK